MASDKLDQIVKGAAVPSASAPEHKTRELSPELFHDSGENHDATPAAITDPTALLPSSPPQIYLNLLILEASLRSQYLTLRARRRQNVFFLGLLATWNVFFFYALFLQPREDGSGIGGSIYWVVETTEKVALMGGIVTGILIWGTGQWERGVRWPRRFVAVTNRGLRTMNCKIIVLKGPWWKEFWHHLSLLLPLSSYYTSYGSSYHYVEVIPERQHQHTKHIREDEYEHVREEDLAPGGDCVRLLLLPKPFSPDFRENWELYRNEYWEKENERRAQLLQRVRQQQRQNSRDQGRWIPQLTGSGGSTPVVVQSREGDLEKSTLRPYNEKDARRTAGRRPESHLHTAPRSSAPSTLDTEDRPPSRDARGSLTSADGRRKGRGSFIGNRQSVLKGPSLFME